MNKRLLLQIKTYLGLGLMYIIITMSAVGAQSHVNRISASAESISVQKQVSHDFSHALFWSRGQTWIADLKKGILYRSPRLYAEGPGGTIFEYRLQQHSQRQKNKKRPYGHMYRWVSFDRELLGGQQIDTLTTHFEPQDLQGDFNDEHQVLQFTGDWVTLSRWVEQRVDQKHLRASSMYTINLAGMKALTSPQKPDRWLNWVRTFLPQLIPTCLQSSPFTARWELPGQRTVFWMLLSPNAQADHCPYQLSALRMTSMNEMKPVKQLTWKNQSIFDEGEKIFSGVVDTLLHDSGNYALLLEGPERNEDLLFIPNINRLVEPDTRRFLTLWRRNESPTTFSFTKDIEIQRLDGARWISNDHALLQILESHFQPVATKPCYQQLETYKVKRYRRPPRPRLQGHMCRIETRGRAWSGIQDLAAAYTAVHDNRTLYLDFWIQDPERSSKDEITLYFGDPKNPQRLRLRSYGLLGSDHLRDQVLFRWKEIKTNMKGNVPQDSPESWLGGYRVSVEIPLALVQQHMSAKIRDIDPSLPGSTLYMWLIGTPSQAGEPDRPSPIEVH
jgi:hypothetical protein